MPAGIPVSCHRFPFSRSSLGYVVLKTGGRREEGMIHRVRYLTIGNGHYQALA
jgi:hypothetical protein